MIDEKKKRNLIDMAITASSNAYAPYSKFTVGAALLGDSGRIYTGCNVENASYGLAICAERTAICKAVSEGEKRFVAIAIVGPQRGLTCSPCGACRQFIAEFGLDIEVILEKDNGFIELSARDLLPYSFCLDGEKS